jgi:preprotein translocase subunit YajC
MNNLIFLATSTDPASTGLMIVWIGAMALLFYFMIIRPQKKQQKQHQTLISTVETGDSVLTSGGFYGVVIDIMEEVVIVEFGNNKNCRIPMKKSAIIEIEKPSSAETDK